MEIYTTSKVNLAKSDELYKYVYFQYLVIFNNAVRFKDKRLVTTKIYDFPFVR